jgi:hypothetical protein
MMKPDTAHSVELWIENGRLRDALTAAEAENARQLNVMREAFESSKNHRRRAQAAEARIFELEAKNEQLRKEVRAAYYEGRSDAFDVEASFEKSFARATLEEDKP